MSDMLRITGLATGIDTESMIQQLMKVEYMRVDRVKQQRQYTEWQMDAYRDIINLLRGFRDEYFDTANPLTNLRSSAAFGVYTSSAQVNGVDTNVVTVNATSSAVPGTHTISSITSLAEKALWQSTSSVSGGLTGDDAVNLSGLKEGKSFDITIDGVRKTITLQNDYSAKTVGDLATDLQKEINKIFYGNESASEITVSDNGGKLQFAGNGHIIEISTTPNTYVSDLGFSNSQTNSITGSELDFSGGPISVSGNIKIDVNGTSTDVAVNITNAADINDFVSQLQTNIDSALGAGTIRVTNDSNKMKLVSYDTSNEITVLSGNTNDVLSSIGFNSGTKINKLEGKANITTSDTGKEFDIYVDGTQYHIDLTADYTDIASLASAIDSQITDPDITVTDDGNGNLVFTGTNGKEIRIENSKETIVDELGFDVDTNNKNIVDLDKSLSYNFGITGDVNFEINDVQFSFNQDDTIKEIINEVNASSAGVTLSYSSLTDTFTLESDKEGFANTITSVSGDLLVNKFKLQEVREGSDAEFTLDGVTTTRSSNTFTIDGVEYTLNSTYAGTNPPIEITVNSNPDEVIEKIKGFVEKYNEVISKINSKLTEERYYDYKPLTEAQKEEMSEEEIELWEEKAKSGILRSDPLLQRIVDGMRRALYDSVEGVGISLYDIGITTSTNYEDKGKLVINETKLREALEENPEEVIELFTKDSDIDYLDTANRSQRYTEEGLAERLYDILQDNIRITRDNDNKKGILLEKAGMEGDTTYFNNLLYAQLEDYNERIDELMVELTEKEDYYYIMFAKMETAIQQMNAQMSWLMSQTGGGMY